MAAADRRQSPRVLSALDARRLLLKTGFATGLGCQLDSGASRQLLCIRLPGPTEASGTVGQTAPRAAAVQWQCVLLASAAAPGRHR